MLIAPPRASGPYLTPAAPFITVKRCAVEILISGAWSVPQF